MENDEDAKQGKEGHSSLVAKFQSFLTPKKSTNRPWYHINAVSTVGDMFHALPAMGADGFTMHESLEGCCSWV